MEEHNQHNNEEQANADKTLPENVSLEQQNKNGLFILISILLLFLLTIQIIFGVIIFLIWIITLFFSALRV